MLQRELCRKQNNRPGDFDAIRLSSRLSVLTHELPPGKGKSR